MEEIVDENRERGYPKEWTGGKSGGNTIPQDTFDVRDMPFIPDESRKMTLKESVIEARTLRARGLALGKEGDQFKSEAKEYHVSIMKGLEDVGTDSMKFDGKAVSVKEMEEWAFPQEHKQELIKWCIEEGFNNAYSKTRECITDRLKNPEYTLDMGDEETYRVFLSLIFEEARMEFLDIPTSKFKTACKAAVEAEQDLPPYAELKTFNKLNGV